MGYFVYKMEGNEPDGPLDAKAIAKLKLITYTKKFCSTREITGRHKLEPGRYLLVPCTSKPDQEGEFLLRIYSEQPGLAMYAL